MKVRSIFFISYFFIGMCATITSISYYVQQDPISIYYIIYGSLLIFITIVILDFKKKYGIIFEYMEKSEWLKLQEVLSELIFEKKKIKHLYVSAYITTETALSQVENIRKIESFLYKNNINFFLKYSPSLSISYLSDIENNEKGLIEFINRVKELQNKDDTKRKINSWILWEEGFYYFLIGDKKYKEYFNPLMQDPNPLVAMLSIYVCANDSSNENDPHLSSSLEKFKLVYNKIKINYKITEQTREHIQINLLHNILENAKSYIFDDNY